LCEADNPPKAAWREWALGSAAFIERTFALAASQDEQQRQRTSRRLKAVTMTEIIAGVPALAGWF
jgi:putative transposase